MQDMEDMRGVLPAKPVRFMHKLRAFIRAKNLAYTTEKTYCLWITLFLNSLSTSISCTSFSGSTEVSRLKEDMAFMVSYIKYL
jgi:hypothetical protein